MTRPFRPTSYATTASDLTDALDNIAERVGVLENKTAGPQQADGPDGERGIVTQSYRTDLWLPGRLDRGDDLPPAELKYQVFDDVLYPGWWSVCTRDDNGRMYCLHDGGHNHQGDAEQHARELNEADTTAHGESDNG